MAAGAPGIRRSDRAPAITAWIQPFDILKQVWTAGRLRAAVMRKRPWGVGGVKQYVQETGGLHSAKAGC